MLGRNSAFKISTSSIIGGRLLHSPRARFLPSDPRSARKQSSASSGRDEKSKALSSFQNWSRSIVSDGLKMKASSIVPVTVKRLKNAVMPRWGKSIAYEQIMHESLDIVPRDTPQTFLGWSHWQSFRAHHRARVVVLYSRLIATWYQSESPPLLLAAHQAG